MNKETKKNPNVGEISFSWDFPMKLNLKMENLCWFLFSHDKDWDTAKPEKEGRNTCFSFSLVFFFQSFRIWGDNKVKYRSNQWIRNLNSRCGHQHEIFFGCFYQFLTLWRWNIIESFKIQWLKQINIIKILIKIEWKHLKCMWLFITCCIHQW